MIEEKSTLKMNVKKINYIEWWTTYTVNVMVKPEGNFFGAS